MKILEKSVGLLLALVFLTCLGDVHSETNASNSWAAIGPFGGAIRALAVNPQTPTTLYAGANNYTVPGCGGVYKSTNGGSTWNAASSGLTNTDIRALIIHPLTPSTLYAGTHGGGVFKA